MQDGPVAGPLRARDPRREVMLEPDEVAAMLRLHGLGCLAHIRRKFVDIMQRQISPIAEEAVNRIAGLYAVEKQARDQTDSRRARSLARCPAAAHLRQVQARQGDPLRPDPPEKLRPYLDHGCLEADNNSAESAVKSVALGRIEACLGVSPIHAARSRPRSKLSIGGAKVVNAMTITGPMPGMVMSRLATSSFLARCLISRSRSSIRCDKSRITLSRSRRIARAGSGRLLACRRSTPPTGRRGQCPRRDEAELRHMATQGVDRVAPLANQKVARLEGHR
jgi:hypothetical protein